MIVFGCGCVVVWLRLHVCGCVFVVGLPGSSLVDVVIVTHPSSLRECIKWSPNEAFCAKLESNELHFFSSDDFRKPLNKLKLDNISTFEFAPSTEGPPRVAVFAPSKKVWWQ